MSINDLPSFSSRNNNLFRLLPPELISTIFRFLDADSLLSVNSTCERFRNICSYGPKLRCSLKKRIFELKREQRKRILNPSFGVKVFRKPSVITPAIHINGWPDRKFLETTRKGMNNWCALSASDPGSSYSTRHKKTNHCSMRI